MKWKDKSSGTHLLMVCLPVCISLFIYIALRACFVSFTHDEALSYNLVKGKEYLGYTANNHLLNTWLMALCIKLYGERELALRLPNVLLFLVYLFFCCKLLSRSKRNSLCFFLHCRCFFLIHLFLIFFSLARGYGLSMGFMAGALYYFLHKDFKEHNFNSFIKDFIPAMLLAAMALLSNLSMVNFYIAMLALFLIQYVLNFWNDKEMSVKKHLLFILFMHGRLCTSVLYT